MIALGVGFNLGNRFDNDEQPNDINSVRYVIDKFSDKGFTSIRIPVTWYRSSGCVLDDDIFMKKLDNAVDYSIKKGLKVVLDAHHEHWLFDSYDDNDKIKFQNLWTRIAEHYDYIADNRIMYDILNEPHGVFDFNNNNIELYINRTRAINNAGYKGVRKVTKEKVVILEPNEYSVFYNLNKIYPTKYSLPGHGIDKKIAVSGHIYGPTEFTLQDGKTSYFKNTAEVLDFYKKIVNNLKKWHKKTGIQIYLGEFGVGAYPENQSRRNDDRVRAYYYYITKLFLNEGWPISVWCDSGWFRLYDNNGKWLYGLADQIIKAKKEEL